jgi:hypothetical protein
MTERDERGRYTTSNPDGDPRADFLAEVFGIARKEDGSETEPSPEPQEEPEILQLIAKGYEAKREQEEANERAYLASFGIDPDQLAEDAGS